MTPEQLTQLFSTCGPITNLRLCGDSNHSTRFAFVEFANSTAAEAALSLNQLHIGSSALRVAMAKAPINKSPAPRSSSSPVSSATCGTSSNLNNAPLSNSNNSPTPISYGAIGQQTHSTVNANLPIHSLPPEKQDAVARTVYIGSVDVKIPGPKLVEFFVSTCGPVVKSRLAGDSVSPLLSSSRFFSSSTSHLPPFLAVPRHSICLHRVRISTKRTESTRNVRNLYRQLPHQVCTLPISFLLLLAPSDSFLSSSEG
jgi:RNA recognition motif-containing protein